MKFVRRIGTLGVALALGACVSAPRPTPAPPPAAPAPVAAPPQAVGLDRVMGRTATQLVQLFGNPDQDLRERTARRLQFAGPVCVLDAYLYPPARGGEAVVTHIDARRPNGDAVDRAACIAALVRRR